MKKIGVLSDTHGYLHPKLFDFFKGCDEIWHAGDIGNDDLLDQLSLIAPVKAVYGNCDSWETRSRLSEHLVFPCEKHLVAMMHIVGKPAYYDPAALKVIREEKPTIFIAGHSHILRVVNDADYHLLYINPGAAGRYGIHTRLTFLRFVVDGEKLSQLEVWDEPKQLPCR